MSWERNSAILKKVGPRRLEDSGPAWTLTAEGEPPMSGSEFSSVPGRPQGPVINGITQQLDSIGAHDPEYAAGIAKLMIEAAAQWQLAHGVPAAQIAEHLQTTADTVFLASNIAGSVG